MASQLEHNNEKVSVIHKCFKFFREMTHSTVNLDNVLLQRFR